MYKIARKEGIELAQPFNAVTTSWSQDDLNQALLAIKNGVPVQKAAAEYKIPTGTLYGRCKKGGIELSKSSNVLWSEEDMSKALESVKTSGMSINQVKNQKGMFIIFLVHQNSAVWIIFALRYL